MSGAPDGRRVKAAHLSIALQQLHNQLCGDLDRIKGRFNGTPKVSLVVRFDDPEKGVWLTDDTAKEAVAYIKYMENRFAEEKEAAMPERSTSGSTRSDADPP